MFEKKLKNAADKSSIELSDKQLEQFNCFYNEVIEWNKKFNLTAITEPDDFAIKHVIDSLVICSDDVFVNAKTMIDVGTGAGFPGIPLKIFKPDIKVTLLDSLNKRIHFLNHVIEKLKLNDIVCIHSRAEDAAHNSTLREKFDIAVSRAVAKFNILAEYCMPFVKVNGTFIAFKGANIDTEINDANNAIKILGGNNIEVVPQKLINNDLRNIIYTKKYTITPDKFPRKAGIPEKKPLF